MSGFTIIVILQAMILAWYLTTWFDQSDGFINMKPLFDFIVFTFISMAMWLAYLTAVVLMKNAA